MSSFLRSEQVRPRERKGLAATVLLAFSICSCAVARPLENGLAERLRETANLIEEVKAFGKTLGIEPTPALSQTTENAPGLSMLWLWLQRLGTLALRAPIDIRMAIGFATVKEQLRLEQVYKVDGYSVFYRQGNEFADQRSVATVGFAAEGIIRRVKIVLHEDLHGENNFNLPWEIEEGIVTPLSSLATVEFFKQNGNEKNAKDALAALEEERKLSRELSEVVKEAERMFKNHALEEAKKKILALIASYPTYSRQFQRQIAGQHPATVLEAKLSHDLAYFRYFDVVVALFENAPSLKTLIAALKTLSPDATTDDLEGYFENLRSKYGAAQR